MQAVIRPHLLSNREQLLTDIDFGMTVSEVVGRIVQVNNQLRAGNLAVLIDGETIPQRFWGERRILKTDSRVEIATVLRGGGGNSKAILGTIAIIALSFFAGPMAAALGPGMTTATGALTTAGLVAKAGIMLVGSLLVHAVFAPPRTGANQGGENSPTYSFSGQSNQPRRFARLPRIYGRHRYVADLAAMPYTVNIGADSYIYALYSFGYGPLKLEDFRIGQNPLTNYDNYEIHVHETFTDPSQLKIFKNDVWQDSVSFELRQGAPVVVTTQLDTNQAIVDITFPTGLLKIEDDGDWSILETAMVFSYRPLGGGAFVPLQIDNVSNGVEEIAKKFYIGEDGVGITQTEDGRMMLQDGVWVPAAKPGWPAGTIEFVGWMPQGALAVAGSKLTIGAWTLTVSSLFLLGLTKTIGGVVCERVDVTFTTGLPADLEYAPDNAYMAFSYTNPAPVGGSNRMFFSRKQQSVFSLSVRFTFAVPGQYEIQIEKEEPDHADDDPHHMWRRYVTAIRSIKNIPPINPEVPMTVVELSMKATGQLNGTIEQFSAIATSILRQWNGSAWVVGPTRNPAWVYMDVLQGTANARPMPDSRMDLSTLRQWAVLCDTVNPPFTGPMGTCDFVVDRQYTVWDLLQNIASTGRASPTMKDNRYSVLIDSADRQPVQMFTPRNSRNLHSSRTYLDEPHAFRVKWIDALNNFEAAETIIYNSGRNALNSTVFEDIQTFGITRGEQALRWGRYMFAQAKLRQERFTIETDIENIVCTRGDLVLVAHDVIEVGGQASRIVEIEGQRLYLDAPPHTDIIDDVTAYGVRIRQSDGFVGPVMDLTALGNDGEYDYIEVAGSLVDVAVDNLLVLGPKLQTVGEYVVDFVRPSSDLAATIGFEEYAPAVFNAEYTGIETLEYVPQGAGSAAPAVRNLTVTARVLYDANGRPMAMIRAAWRPAQGMTYQADNYRVWLLSPGSGHEEYLGQTTDLFMEVGPYDLTTLNGYEFIFRVRPFYGARGLGPLSEASVVVEYVPSLGPPLVDFFDVDDLPGATRRYSWSFTDGTPPAVVGIEVRYLNGTVDTPVWNSATPVIDGPHALENGAELHVPVGAGTFTFMARTVDNKGVLSASAYVLIRALTDAVIDLSPPPTPTGFTAVGGMGVVFFSVDEPTYTIGNGHAYTQVYAAEITTAQPNPTFANATPFGSFTATVGSVAAPSATQYRFWAKWVTKNGGISVTPAGPVDTETAIDIPLVLDALEGQITESHLHNSLGSRIDLIDAPASIAGSVNARISDETTARIADVNQEAADRTAAVQAEAEARGTAVANEAWVREQGDTALATQIQTVTATLSGGFDTGKAWYYDTTVEGWTANNATLAWHAGGWVDITPTANAPGFNSPTALALAGGLYTKIRARITRIAGNGWSGKVYYNTSAGPNVGHGFQFGYHKAIPPVNTTGLPIGETAIVEWDMAALTQGGTDWINSTISQIRIELGAVAADVFSVDWVGIGRSAPPASVAGLQSEQSARVTADTAIASDVTALTARVGTTESGLVTEQTTRATADTALASSITALSAKVEGEFDTAAIWNFDTGLDGWTVVANATLAFQAGGYARSTATTTGTAGHRSPLNLAINGALYNVIRFRITRVAGTGWGAGARSYYRTSGHSEVGTFSKIIPDPGLAIGQSAVIDLDMSQLSAGGTDWITNTITAIRLDFGATATGDVFDIDWIAVGRKAPAASNAALVAEQSARATADTAIASDVTALTARVGTAEGAITTEQTARANADTALSNSITALTARVGTAEADINTEETARANADTAITNSVTALTARVGTAEADINTEETARADADTALSSRITVMEANSTAGFDTAVMWNFDSTLDGWVAGNSAVMSVTSDGQMRIDSVDDVLIPFVWSPTPLAIDGSHYTKIRARITRRAGSGWRGIAYYTTAGHGTVGGVSGWWKQVPVNPVPNVGDTAIVEWDMAALNAGGTDWLDSIITRIRLDIASLGTDLFDVDWVGVGRIGPPASHAALATEQTARADADSALSQQMTTLYASVGGGFDAYRNWTFDSNTVEGWTVGGGTLAAANGKLTLTHTVADGFIMSPTGLGLPGATYTKIRALVKRISGSGWQGTAYYSTAGHGFISTFVKTISQPAFFGIGETVLIEWDMAALSVGGADWTSSTILGIRLDLGFTATDAFEFDWVAIGRTSPAASVAALSEEQTARADADTAQVTSITTLQASINVSGEGAIFREAWIGGTAAIDQWEKVSSGGGVATLAATTASAARNSVTLSVGDNVGDDMSWLVHKGLIPFDSAKLYKLEATVQRNAGAANAFYLGFVGVASDGVTLVNTTGLNTYSNQHFIGAVNQTPAGATWVTFTGYVQGHSAANGTGGAAPDPKVPGKMHPNVRYLRPVMVLNYNGQAGKYLVSRVDVTDGNPTLNSISLQEEATVRADETGDLFAQYTVKVDANGYVTGFGFASTVNNGVPSSSFAVRSDAFYVASPSGPGIAPSMPFIVRTVAGSQNGQTIPIGVYMRAAFIENGAITTAKIGTAAITTALIGDAQITTAKIADLSVDAAKIADATISTAKIADGQITNAKIGAAAVDNAKIANLAVNTAKLADAAITTAKIGTLQVQGGHIQDGTITSAKIGDAQITTAKIGLLQVQGGHIQDLTVATLKIGANAVTFPAAAFTAGVVSSSLGNETQIQSAVIVTTGAQVLMWFSVELSWAALGVEEAPQVLIKRDGNLIATYTVGFVSQDNRQMFCTSLIDTPSAASHTYTMHMKSTGAFLKQATNRGITLIEVKK